MRAARGNGHIRIEFSGVDLGIDIRKLCSHFRENVGSCHDRPHPFTIFIVLDMVIVIFRHLFRVN